MNLNNQVQQIIGAVDPDMDQCRICKRYFSRGDHGLLRFQVFDEFRNKIMLGRRILILSCEECIRTLPEDFEEKVRKKYFN